VFFEGLIGSTLVAMGGVGEDEIQVDDPRLFSALMPAWGEMPLPPYITAPLGDPERYQTVFAAREASAAAPTAGLHFTPALLERMTSMQFEFVRVELEVGLGTFAPVRSELLENHHIHSERGVITTEAADAIMRAKGEGRPVIAIGTTTTRLLEHVAHEAGGLAAFEGEVTTFITPGYDFRIVDQLVTNFHLPGSTLLGLVAAFAGLERTLGWYRLAVQERYRFYSFGDAMLIR